MATELKGSEGRAASAARLLQSHDVETVLVGVPDMDGIFRGKAMSAKAFLDELELGIPQCDVIFGWDIAENLIDGLRFTGWETGYPDLIMVPDLETLKVAPWLPHTATVIVDVADEEGRPLAISPRRALRRIKDRAHALGYDAQAAFEFEFKIYQEDARSLRQKDYAGLEPISPGLYCYSITRAAGDRSLLETLRDRLTSGGIDVATYNREHGEGMYEMNLPHTSPLEAADEALMFRTGAKMIAQDLGYTATFMAKAFDTQDGTSGHLHMSLWQGGQGLFSGAGEMPSVMRHFLGGVLALLPEWIAFYAPFVNSYKRFVPGTWAPTSATWATDNRTTAIRVLRPRHRAQAARIEVRVPGSDTHPYLAAAAALASGLYGIENAIEPPPETKGSGYAKDSAPLPRSLKEAALALQASRAARSYFEEEFLDHYIRTRLWEVEQYERQVSSWERRRYFEIL